MPRAKNKNKHIFKVTGAAATTTATTTAAAEGRGVQSRTPCAYPDLHATRSRRKSNPKPPDRLHRTIEQNHTLAQETLRRADTYAVRCHAHCRAVDFSWRVHRRNDTVEVRTAVEPILTPPWTCSCAPLLRGMFAGRRAQRRPGT